MIQMQLVNFLESLILPDGYSLYDFSNGTVVIPTINDSGYLCTKLIRIVRSNKHEDIILSDDPAAHGDLVNVAGITSRIEAAIERLN
jgi:hypothetical protein